MTFREIENLVISPVIGYRIAGHARVGISDCNNSTTHDTSGLILDHTQDGSLRRLTERDGREEKLKGEKGGGKVFEVGIEIFAWP
jgi:hypothetical protein